MGPVWIISNCFSPDQALGAIAMGNLLNSICKLPCQSTISLSAAVTNSVKPAFWGAPPPRHLHEASTWRQAAFPQTFLFQVFLCRKITPLRPFEQAQTRGWLLFLRPFSNVVAKPCCWNWKEGQVPNKAQKKLTSMIPLTQQKMGENQLPLYTGEDKIQKYQFYRFFWSRKPKFRSVCILKQTVRMCISIHYLRWWLSYLSNCHPQFFAILLCSNPHTRICFSLC